MESFGEIINYIGRTNLFNFAIFLAIILYVCKKIDVSAKLESAKKSIADDIEHSKSEKAESEKILKKIEASAAGIEDEVDEIIKKAGANAKLVGDKILADARKSAESIKEDAEKTLEGKIGMIKNDILKRASEASIEVAKEHIIDELKNNPDLHDKLINESIDAIDGAVI